jgi:hypothetical protein
MVFPLSFPFFRKKETKKSKATIALRFEQNRLTFGSDTMNLS